MLTCHILAQLEFLRDTLIDLFECQAHFQAKVIAPMLLRTALATAKTSEAMTSEDVAKHGEDIVHVHGCATEATEAACPHRSVESELIVLLTLLGVVKHVIGFGSLFELLLSLLVARVAVRVIFDGYLAISFLDLVFRCRLADAKDFIIVSFHKKCLLAYCHLGVANYFFVEFITGGQAVDNLSFLVIAHAGHHCHGFVNVGVEVGISGIDL